MEWISVKDDLPNKYERVLVSDGKNICLHYKQSGWNFEGSRGDDLFCEPCDNRQCDIITDKITHWRALPELPK